MPSPDPSARRRSVFAVLAAGLAAAAGLAVAVSAAAQAPLASADYRLGPRDRVKVEVFEVPELNTEARVAEDGNVTLPVIGAMPAQGLTAGELADAIEQRLEADYVNRATVRVELTEVLSKTVTVLGAVRSPGTLGHPGHWTLLEAVTAAGGLATDHGERVHVQRRATNGLTDQVSIPLAELIQRMDPKVNLPVLPDDVINVERTRKVTIYLLGEIAAAGALQFESTEPVTLLTAIARAGGLTERASPKLRIKRRGEDGLMREIEAHYGRILDGQDPDLELEDGDLLVVKESFF